MVTTIKGGLRERWHPLGHTVLYAEYEKINDGANSSTPRRWLIGVNSDTTLWGLGVVQEIDAAAMSLWLSYRHIEADSAASQRYPALLVIGCIGYETSST